MYASVHTIPKSLEAPFKMPSALYRYTELKTINFEKLSLHLDSSTKALWPVLQKKS